MIKRIYEFLYLSFNGRLLEIAPKSIIKITYDIISSDFFLSDIFRIGPKLCRVKAKYYHG